MIKKARKKPLNRKFWCQLVRYKGEVPESWDLNPKFGTVAGTIADGDVYSMTEVAEGYNRSEIDSNGTTHLWAIVVAEKIPVGTVVRITQPDGSRV